MDGKARWTRMLAFFGGTLLGGALGVVTMCLVQINRDDPER